MSSKISRKDLGQFGKEYEYRLVSTFVIDKSFFKNMAPIIDQNAFTESSLRMIVGVMKEYYFEYENVPSYEIIQRTLNVKVQNETDREFCTETIEKLEALDTEGIEQTKDMAYKFFKQQNLICAINKMIAIVGDGDIEKYDECEKLITDALSVGKHEDLTTTPLTNIEEDLSSDNVTIIPTGISSLDEVLGGGVEKGNIAALIAPTGRGKTSMTTAISAYAATYKDKSNYMQGFKVLQIVFEDTLKNIKRKYIARVSQIQTSDLNKTPELTQRAKELAMNYEYRDMMKNNIVVARMKTGATTVSEIKKLILEQTNKGFKPDMVIIDYFECIKPSSSGYNEDKWSAESRTMRELERLAPEVDVLLWVPIQGTKDSIGAEKVTLDKGGGSVGKVQIPQVVLSVTRSDEDIEANRGTISVLKNRNGESSKDINDIIFNNGTCTYVCTGGKVDFGSPSNRRDNYDSSVDWRDY